MLIELMLSLSAIAASPSEEILTMAREGYAQHVESFPNVCCEYEIRHGRSPSIENAIASGPHNDVLTFRAKWMKRGSDELLVITPPVSWKEDVTSSPVPIVRVLRNARHEVSYSELFSGGNVVDLSVSESLIAFTPLDMGALGSSGSGSPAAIISKTTLSRLINVTQDSNFICFTRLFEQRADRQETTYKLALTKGFSIHSIATTINKATVSEVFITSCKNVSGGRWFPMRSVSVVPRDDGHVVAREFRVLKLDVDHVPPDREFSITIPKGGHLNDPRAVGSQLVAEGDLQIRLDDLSQIFGETRVAIEEKRREQDELLGRNNKLLWASYIVASLVLIGVLFVAGRWVRARWSDA